MRRLKLDSESKKDILNNLLKRSPNNYGEFESRVNDMITAVREQGDAAVFSYTRQFDGADIHAGNIRVTDEEIQEAYRLVDEKLLAVIRKAKVNIRTYHEKQKQYSWFDSEDSGIILVRK